MSFERRSFLKSILAGITGAILGKKDSAENPEFIFQDLTTNPRYYSAGNHKEVVGKSDEIARRHANIWLTDDPILYRCEDSGMALWLDDVYVGRLLEWEIQYDVRRYEGEIFVVTELVNNRPILRLSVENRGLGLWLKSLIGSEKAVMVDLPYRGGGGIRSLFRMLEVIDMHDPRITKCVFQGIGASMSCSMW